jgi:hypothetical protein
MGEWNLFIIGLDSDVGTCIYCRPDKNCHNQPLQVIILVNVDGRLLVSWT